MTDCRWCPRCGWEIAHLAGHCTQCGLEKGTIDFRNGRYCFVLKPSRPLLSALPAD